MRTATALTAKTRPEPPDKDGNTEITFL